MKPSLFNICLALSDGRIGLAVVPANAKDERLGTSGKWEAYRSGSGKIRSVSSPARRSSMKANMIEQPGQTRVLSPITTVTLISAALSAASQVIASRKVNLCFYHRWGEEIQSVSVNTRAWATKPEDDRGLVKAMKRGRTSRSGDFHPGNTTIDTYSLKGLPRRWR